MDISSSKISSGIFRGSITLAVFSLVSRLTGLLRDRILAGRFGAGETLDIYYAAFKIPDFIFHLVIIGAVSAAFIPTFINYYERDKNEGWRLASNFLNTALFFVITASLILIIFIPDLMPLVAPGFGPLQTAYAVDLTRIMFLSPVIFAISTVLGSILQSLRRFLAFAIAPSFYNFGIIFGALYLEPSLGLSGLGWGVIIGALLHLLIQLPAVFRAGFRWFAVFDFADSGLRKVFKLMMPRTLGLAVTHINLIIITAIASTITVGSISIFNFANNLQFLPISMIGVSISIAIFPTLSSLSGRDNEAFINDYLSAMKQIIFFGVPVSFAMFIFREPIVALLLGVGRFGPEDIGLTAAAVGIFAFSALAISLVSLINRAFYAFHNTVIPLVVGAISVSLNIVLSFLLVGWFKIEEFSLFWQKILGVSDGPAFSIIGLALAWSLSHVLYSVLIHLKFIKFAGIKKSGIWQYMSKTIGASLLSCGILIFALPYIPKISVLSGFVSQFLSLSLDVLIFGIMAFVFCRIFGIKEAVIPSRFLRRV